MSGYGHALLVKIVPNFFTYAASTICEITATVYAPAALAIKFTSSDFALCSLNFKDVYKRQGAENAHAHRQRR